MKDHLQFTTQDDEHLRLPAITQLHQTAILNGQPCLHLRVKCLQCVESCFQPPSNTWTIRQRPLYHFQDTFLQDECLRQHDTAIHGTNQNSTVVNDPFQQPDLHSNVTTRWFQRQDVVINLQHRPLHHIDLFVHQCVEAEARCRVEEGRPEASRSESWCLPFELPASMTSPLEVS